jgi:hypothetical protein
MLLKISLGLAILVGLATLYFTIPVSDKITGLKDSLAASETAKTEAQTAQAKAVEESKKLKTTLEATTKDLAEKTNRLAFAEAGLKEQQKRADRASAELVTTTQERNEARQELNKWTALGLAPEKIRDELDAKKRLETERVAIETEKKLLSQNLVRATAKLRQYEPDEAEVVLPLGTKGKVAAVDPKFDFVVLDIGANQGLLENAKMLVMNRDGKLVAKVKITKVEPNRAIANIMPEWKQDDVNEGDLVVY